MIGCIWKVGVHIFGSGLKEWSIRLLSRVLSKPCPVDTTYVKNDIIILLIFYIALDGGGSSY